MLPATTIQQPLRVTTARNRLCVQVPWNRAEEVQTRLRRQGIGSTLHLNPAERVASLELWPGVDAEKAQAALEKIKL
jgi:hypothetical protein